jgi:ABC-type nitrate/sulfonate/bicarbonate transport system permease component
MARAEAMKAKLGEGFFALHGGGTVWSRLRPFVSCAVVLAAWEMAVRLHVIGGRAFPPPSGIVADWWNNAELYLFHITATLQSASLGFLFGSGIAIGAAVVFAQWPMIERLCRGISITLFAVPAITIGPILVLSFRGSLPQIILAAICVYFPTMIATLIGLREIDPRPMEVIHAYGGGKFAILRYIRLRAALPGMLAGLRVAAPSAMLGAILGEFGAGTRWGLGSFLLGSLGQANASRIWGIGLCSTAVAAIGYVGFGLAGRAVLGTSTSVTVAANSAPNRLGDNGPRGRTGRMLLTAGAILAPFAAWWLTIRLLHLNPIIARDPVSTMHYLFFAEASASARKTLWDAFASTLPVAALGMVLGVLAAFMLGALSVLRPAVVRALMPLSLVLQTMPLVALTPIIVLIFGRDLLATLAVTVLVVFFPAFVTLAQGFSQVPSASLDVVRAYGYHPFRSLRLVSIPSALPYLFAAARLVAPRALLGAMIAEWLATGTGVGQLLNASRGMMDYGMIWATAFVSVVVATLAYQGVSVAERLLVRT